MSMREQYALAASMTDDNDDHAPAEPVGPRVPATNGSRSTSRSATLSSLPAPTVSAEEAARQRDIARNIDFLRVLAGEKSRLADDPTTEKVGYVAFGGGGQSLGGGGSAAPAQTNTTGEKRRVIVNGELTTASGLSDTADERARRAAAARARLAKASSETSAT